MFPKTEVSSEQRHDSVASAWPLSARVTFRFSCIYWVLYFLPSSGAVSLVDLLPWGGEPVSNTLSWPLAKLSHWVGMHVLHLQGQGADWHPTGSGDTAMNYTLVLCVAVLAALGTAIWSAVDEPRGCRGYRTAYAWLRLFLRFTLAVTLLGYGYAKVFPSQFGLEPSLWNLNERYGDSSPMHLLWFFMQSSRPYTIFGGLMEAVPGVLLLFRRTSTVGLLGGAAVMANVVLLNFTYDVPVKLYSTHLLLLCVFLLLPDVLPMWRFFISRRPAELTGVWLPVWERRPLRIATHVLQGLVLIACAWMGYGTYRSRETAADHSPLFGVWRVESADSAWANGSKPQTVVLDGIERVQSMLENGETKRFPVKYDLTAHNVRFTKMDRDTLLRWETPDTSHLLLQGTWMGAPTRLQLARANPEHYLLTSRGFHWVQEVPFNK